MTKLRCGSKALETVVGFGDGGKFWRQEQALETASSKGVSKLGGSDKL
jgi:hypothetical protein